MCREDVLHLQKPELTQQEIGAHFQMHARKEIFVEQRQMNFSYDALIVTQYVFLSDLDILYRIRFFFVGKRPEKFY